MFKPIALTADEIRTPTPPLPEQAVNNVFKVFHGFYGNLFLSKFASGEVGEQGDAGIVSARQIWGHGLRKFGPGTVKAALSQCMEAHPEFPPSLPQFVALCEAVKPREVFHALPAPPAVDSQAKKDALAKLQGLKAKVEARGLTLLKEAIADAVGCAGGDEAQALYRLDRMLTAKGVA